MPIDGADTVQQVTWWIAVAAIIANLGWNWLNRRHTNSLAADIRREQFEMDRWVRLRSRIETNLGTLTENLRGAPLLFAKPDLSEAEAATFMNVLELTVNDAHDNLSRSLEEAGNVEFCDELNWLQCAYGATYGTETSWDQILTVLGTASRQKLDLARYLRRLKTYSDDIETSVRNVLDQQDAKSGQKMTTKH